MATYIALLDYTRQGLDNIRDSPKRAAMFMESVRKTGATVQDLFWTTGKHDGVLIIDAPDEQSAMALMLSLSRAGNVRTTTMRAFDRNEMEGILSRIA